MSNGSLTAKIISNSIFLFLGSLSAKIFSFVFYVLISQYFGADGLGIFSLGLTVVSILVSLSLVGLSDGLITFVGRYRDDSEGAERLVGVVIVAFLIAITFSIILSIVVTVFSDRIAVDLFDEPRLSQLLPIFALGIPAMVLVRLSGPVMQALNRSQYKILLQHFIPKGGLLLITILIISTQSQLYILSAAYVGTLAVGGLFGVIVMLWVIISQYGIKFKLEIKNLITYSAPLMFSGFIGKFLNWIDTFFVGYFLPTQLVGQYQAAFLLGSNIPIFVTAISGGLYPNIAKWVENNEWERVIENYSQAVRWSIILTLLPTIYLITFSRPVLETLFGPEFSGAALALVFIIVGNSLGAIFGPATETVKSLGHSRFILYTNVFALVLNVLINILMIPRIGIIGAALSTMAVTIFTNGAHYLFVKNHFPVEINLTFLARVFFIGFLSAFPVWILGMTPESILSLSLHVLLYSLIYATLLYVTGTFKHSEIKKIKQIIIQ